MNTRYNERMMTLAIKQAMLGDGSNKYSAKFGAIIFCNKQVLTKGYNQKKSHPIMTIEPVKCSEAIFQHAEINALSKLLRIKNTENMKNLSIAVARIKVTGEFGESRPCQYCLGKLSKFNINNIVYMNKNLEIISEYIDRHLQ